MVNFNSLRRSVDPASEQQARKILRRFRYVVILFYGGLGLYFLLALKVGTIGVTHSMADFVVIPMLIAIPFVLMLYLTLTIATAEVLFYLRLRIWLICVAAPVVPYLLAPLTIYLMRLLTGRL